MFNLLRWAGRLAGIVGTLLAVFAVITRLGGAYMVGGFQTGTLLLAATCALAFACLSYVAILVEGPGR